MGSAAPAMTTAEMTSAQSQVAPPGILEDGLLSRSLSIGQRMCAAGLNSQFTALHYQGRVPSVYLILLIIFFRIFFLGVLQCVHYKGCIYFEMAIAAAMASALSRP